MKLAAMLSQDFQSALLALGEQEIDMLVAYRLKKIVKIVNSELEIYNELLAKIQEKHKPAEGQEVDQQAFMKDFLELVNMEIETPKIKMSEIQKVKITTKNLVILDPVIEDDLESQAQA